MLHTSGATVPLGVDIDVDVDDVRELLPDGVTDAAAEPDTLGEDDTVELAEASDVAVPEYEGTDAGVELLD